MAPMAQRIAQMVDMLPEADQSLAFELVKKLVIAWDSDFTKLTPGERAELEKAEAACAAGETTPDSAIDWS